MKHLSSLRRARIEAACRALVARLGDALNRRDPDALVAVLAPDLCWELPGGGSWHTPADVRSGFVDLWARAERNDLWLDVGNGLACWIEVESACRARSSNWLVMYAGVPPLGLRGNVMRNKPEMIACCRHLFVSTRRGWRIADHRATRLYRSASCALPVPQPSGFPQFT